MRRIIQVLLALCCSIVAQAQGQTLLNTAFHSSARKGTVASFLNDLQTKTGITISYSTASVELSRKVKLKGNEETVGEILETVLADQNASVVERDNKILILPADKQDKPKSGTLTISGYLKDKESKEVLIGAVVFVPALKAGTVTNDYGYYSLTLPADNYKAVYTYIGYKGDTINISDLHDQRIDVQLLADNRLAETIIVAPQKDLVVVDHLHLTQQDIYQRPTLLGEHDIMRRLQHVAGVQSTTEGSSTLIVRGGDPGENLSLLDGVPLYYVDHFDGLTSVYNTEAVKSVDFYKGSFPARYGGRLSSILDVNTKDGDMDRWGGQFTMGLLKASLNVEGPIVKERSSIMLSARRTWIDGVIAPFSNDFAVNFYDVNAKVNYILNKDNRFYISFYNGRDKFKYNDDISSSSSAWHNKVAAAKWTSVVAPKLFVNTTLTYSAFDFEMQDNRQVIENGTIKNSDDYTGTSSVKDLAARLQLRWYPNLNHSIEAGISYSYAQFVPVAVSSNYVSAPTDISTAFYSNEVTIYAEDNIKTGNKWIIRPGLHWANWFSPSFNYSSIQPRLYIGYQAAASHAFYTSFSSMAQFLHLINNNTFGLQQGFWIPSTANIEPEEALQAAVGYNTNIGKDFGLNLELYYKDIQGVTTYSRGKDIFDNTERWQNKITQGKGWSYGAELSADKKFGRFSTMMVYSLSWSWRQFDLLNDGEKFPYRYDRRHNFKITAIYEPNKKRNLAATWTYMSGEAITLPDQIYPDLNDNLLIQQANGIPFTNSYTYNYTEWNNYRLPPIHRLDISANFRKQKGKHMERTWSLGVYNVYARPNVMSVTLVHDETAGALKLTGSSFLQFVPHISYRLAF